MNKTCWNCGHWLIGLGCHVNDEVVQTDHDHSCSSWVEEATEGTVTDYSEQEDDGECTK